MIQYFRDLTVLLVVLISVTVLAETRKKVVIIDSGMPETSQVLPYLCSSGHADFTKTKLEDYHGHGTNVAGLIAKGLNPKTHCMIILKFYHTKEFPGGAQVSASDSYLRALDYAKTLKPHIINLSLAGPYFIPKEAELISSLLKSGTTIVTAAGNLRLDLSQSCNAFPACYEFGIPGFYVVASPSILSNKNGPVTHIRDGNYQCGFNVCLNGTSQAAANFTAELLTGE